ncbi:hypothetical protein DFH11DRAFT_1571977 [Phellopilus nigrolimitatus]|nr:hypothetical protein DFH11DRAFT_1571977 [Phellopilus nigrolimitatus]
MATQALPSYLSASTFTTTVGGVVQTGVETVLVTTALPTQALPPYLSASTFTTTVPLTYFGPSVSSLGHTATSPGSEGSTSPASTATQSSTSSPTAIPSSSSSQPSTSSGVTASSSSSSVSSSTFSSTSQFSSFSSSASPSSSFSSSASPTSSSAASKGLSKGQLAGIIIAAIVAAVVVTMLFMLWCYRRTQRRRSADFVIVDAEGQSRFAGEGDSFLRRSEVEPTARLMTTGTTMPPEGVVPSALPKTPVGSPMHPSGPKVPSPFFHASASSLFFNPSRGPDQSLEKRDSASTRASSTSASPVTIGNIIPPRQLLQMDDQWRQESAGARGAGTGRDMAELGERTEQSGSLLRPLPVFNTDASHSSRHISHPNSMRTFGSQLESDEERATLLTARRVNLNEGGPSTLAFAENDGAVPSSWHSSLGLGLGGLTRLSRLSWFQRLEAMRAQSSTDHPARSRSGSPLRPEVERINLALPRPLSHLTTSSTGDTMYYDAPSSMSTRSGNGNSHNRRPTSMPFLPPRAVVTPENAANSAPQTPRHNNGSDNGSSLNQPALLMLYPPSVPASPQEATSFSSAIHPNAPGTGDRPATHEEVVDILDTPVPAPVAVSPFSTTSTRSGPALPPGLENLANVRAWRESSSDMPSSATFGEGSDRGMSIDAVGGDGGGDILEDAPPLPRHGWTVLRAVTESTTESSHRTLGEVKPETFDIADDVHSRAGSLHSMADRLSPYSTMASGANSRAASRHTFYNSSSLAALHSHSGHSRSDNSGNSGNSGSGSQLVHSNSVTSEGRRRPRREPGEPLAEAPASANSSVYRRARLSAIGGARTPLTTPQRTPAADATFAAGITSLPAEGNGAGTGALVGRTS